MSLNGVSISESESRFSEPRLHYKWEPRLAQELSQPKFIVHGRTLWKRLKTAFSQIAKDYGYENQVHLQSAKIKMKQNFEDFYYLIQKW